jgi:hypothetical protein
MGIINSITSKILKNRIARIENFKKNPVEVQQNIFSSLIKNAKDTTWGKEFHYNKISSIQDFQKTVPLNDYEGLKPFIERIMKGERNLLWHEDIKWLAKSSGTTSDKSKFIPVSKSALIDCHYRCGSDMLAIYCNNFSDSGLFNGKCLTLGGSHKISELNSNIRYGDLSALLMQNLPSWARYFRSPSLEVALMDNWEEKIEALARETIPQNITNVVGVSSWALVLFKRILEITGKENLMEVWPELEVFFHGGVSFTPYREQFSKIICSEKMRYMETYNASEGFFGLEDIPGSEELLLMLDYGIFYEFIPVEELESKNPVVLTLNDVEAGKNYALLISTNSGLWRYIIGDTVKFTSVDPFRIKITGRTKHFINAFGEELMIENAEKALAEACKETGAQIKDYTAGPVFMGSADTGGHEWLIEFNKEPSDLKHFAELLDKNLKTVNSDYEAKRINDFVLKMPIVRKLEVGTFYAWLKCKGKLGGQNKVPRLANDRKYLDEIMSLVKSNP